MKEKRIIPCLDCKDGRVVKGIQFVELKDIGDPVELARKYSELGADELVMLDISATTEGHALMLDVIRKAAQAIDIPLIIGGGIDSLEDIEAVLGAGAAKVSLNTAALENPELVREASQRFGKETLIVAIDAGWDEEEERYYCYTRGGSQKTDREVLAWAKECQELGAGELLVTSIHYDGMKQGFDLDLLKTLRQNLDIPVIASGGAGKAEHFVDLFLETDVAAGLAASVFHNGTVQIGDVKRLCEEAGVVMRRG